MQKALCLSLILAVFFLSGCIRTVYLEEETPPGAVPPPPPGYGAASEQAQEYTPPPSLEDTKPGVKSERRISLDSSSEIIEGFKLAYAEMGSPRIAVFFNRELSDEVREWSTLSRFVISGNLRISEEHTEGGLDRKKVEVEAGPTSVYEQTYIDLEERDLPPEDWMWQFEESFLREFLKAKAHMLDRATIMRLIATESGKQGSAYEPITVKTIEMNALKEKADMFLELLVRENLNSPVGYEFQAYVKEIATGRILANVSSLEWRQKELDEPRRKTYEATSGGYREVQVEQEIFPKLDRVVRLLALDVMDSLVKIWTPSS